jgi:hypothetical protein
VDAPTTVNAPATTVDGATARAADLIAAAAAPTSAALVPETRPVPALRVPVEFAASDSGVGELTWGQWEIWLGMIRQGWLNLGGTKPLPPGTALPDIADELRYLMTRYPSMRTRLRFDHNGRPTQEVFGSGRIVLEVFDAERDADSTAALVEAHYKSAVRDFAGEWPVRMGLVRRGDSLTHLVAIVCHLSTDAAGAQVMLREVAVRESVPLVGVQALELARWQRSPAGQRQHAAAERHWGTVLRALPPRPYPVSSDPREPRHWSGEYTSPALYLALPHIAERTGADSSSVLMALYAVALGRRGVLDPAVFRPLVHNRFRAGLADTVGNLVQSGICVLDVADTTVDEVVRRARRAAMSAYKFAYFDPERMSALFGQVARDQGPQFGLTSFFNDRRASRLLPQRAAEATAQQLKEALTHGSFRWFEKKENPYERLFVHVDDGPESIVLTVCADTHHVSPADNEALARTVEAVAVEAAFDPAAHTGVGVSVSAARP